jgi:hypothetical protein
MINWENYEEYMMMHTDGELSAAEEQELMSFLYEHPELQSELTAFSMSKMIPDTTIIYTKKDTLLQPATEKKVIAFPVWKKYAVAAGVAAILFLSFYKLTTDATEPTTTVAANTQPAVNTTPIGNTENNTAATAATEQNTAPAAQPQQQVAVAGTPTNTIYTRSIATPKAINKDRSTGNNAASNQAVAAVTTMPAEPIGKVVPAEMIAWKNNPDFSAPVVTNLPPIAINIYEGDETTGNSLIDKLPIDELKKKGIESVATAMANGYDKVNAIRQEISGSVISLKIEKRKLVVSF